jgi:hypothetical protein
MTESTALQCRDDAPRRKLARSAPLNGLDYLEVSDDQRRLTVFFLGRAPSWITPRHLRIDGGRRVRGIRVLDVKIRRSEDPERDDCMTVSLDRPGDFSTYTLCVVALDGTGKPTAEVPPDFDPRYSRLCFEFKANCPSDLDCGAEPACEPAPRTEPVIDYLAKDYASFRRVIFDRLALLIPDWQERHVPDLGTTLVELLAYAGDQLSYYQDAVATEAYLDTARQRISVRRHGRLVDYRLHEGCNARAWLTIAVSQSELRLARESFFFVTGTEQLTLRVLKAEELPRDEPAPYLVFEPHWSEGAPFVELRADHNEIRFHTWGQSECCLPRGATSASLVDPGEPSASDPSEAKNRGDDESGSKASNELGRPSPGDYRLRLEKCDVLIFEEVKGARTGHPADADPTHRHVVRLTQVTRSWDPLTRQLVVDVEWAAEDALPFALCLSAVGLAPGCPPIHDVSVARGNVLLVDHGRSVEDELGQVPSGTVHAECGDGCLPAEIRREPGQFRPLLPRHDLTYSAPVPPCWGGLEGCAGKPRFTPAAGLLDQDPRNALPAVQLHSVLAAPEPELERAWSPRQDLLASGPDDAHFVVEIDDERTARLRFGDGDGGRTPEVESHFRAVYRIGNGPSGNVGPEAIDRIVFRSGLPSGVDLKPRNPLPARGGTAPESIAEAKLRIPYQFRSRLERAIVAGDYADIVLRDFAPRVQRAAAILRWNGVVPEVLVAVDQLGRAEADASLLCEVRRGLERYRRIGHDVAVVGARSVPIDLGLHVCVRAGYLRGHVKAALLDAFSDRRLPDGKLGFFHPDRLTFGQGIFLSQVVAAAQAVASVESLRVLRLERLFEGPNGELEAGILPLGPLEIGRLDNDPSFPENGRLVLELEGGR